MQPINPLQMGIDTRPPVPQTRQDSKDFTLHFVFMQAWRALEEQFLLVYLCSACSWYMYDPWSWGTEPASGTGDTAHSGSQDSHNVCLHLASFSRDKEEDASPPKDATLLVQQSTAFSLPSPPFDLWAKRRHLDPSPKATSNSGPSWQCRGVQEAQNMKPTSAFAVCHHRKTSGKLFMLATQSLQSAQATNNVAPNKMGVFPVLDFSFGYTFNEQTSQSVVP